MRISTESAQDINFPLTPEWPTLTARARGAVRMTPATSCELLSQKDRNAFVKFKLTFKDGSSTFLQVGATHTTPQSWIVWMGESPRKHDLLTSVVSNELQIENTTHGWTLRSAAAQLEIDRHTAAIRISDAQGHVAWQSVGQDLFVGDVPMSFAAFKHADGFGMTFDFATCSQICGGGEQFGPTNLRGRMYDVMNSDALGVNGQQ